MPPIPPELPRILLYAALGAAGGYGWHRLVGCSTGACPLTANPYVATIYGALVGFATAMR